MFSTQTPPRKISSLVSKRKDTYIYISGVLFTSSSKKRRRQITCRQSYETPFCAIAVSFKLYDLDGSGYIERQEVRVNFYIYFVLVSCYAETGGLCASVMFAFHVTGCMFFAYVFCCFGRLNKC